MKTLQEWIFASPNRTPGNTLIQSRHSADIYSYHWNLKPVDPHELAVYTDAQGNIIESPHKQERVPVTAALLAELAHIRDHGNSPTVAGNACIEAQKGFGPTAEHLEWLRATLPKSKDFTVIAVSSNTNSFGLKSILLLAEDGEGWEILKSPYGGDELPKQGDTVQGVGDRFNCGTYECPRQLSTHTPKKSREIIAEVRRAQS